MNGFLLAIQLLIQGTQTVQLIARVVHLLEGKFEQLHLWNLDLYCTV